MRTIGKVSDFQVEFGNGVFNCCSDFIDEHGQESAHAGMILECSHCHQSMILAKSKDGKFRWTAYND